MSEKSPRIWPRAWEALSRRSFRYAGGLLCLLSAALFWLSLGKGRIVFGSQPEELSLANGRKALFLAYNTQAPLLIFLHSGGSSAGQSAKLTGFALTAQRRSVNVAFGESRDGLWQYNGLNRIDDRTDEAYVLNLREVLLARGYGAHGVFLVGFSNGGMLALQTACDHPSLFQGVGLISSGMPEAVGEACRELPSRIVAVNGEADTVIPINGGIGVNPHIGPLWKFDRLVVFLQQQRQCAGHDSIRLTFTGAAASSVILLSAAECERAGITQLYLVVNGGHEAYGEDNWKKRLFGSNEFFAPELILHAFLGDASGGLPRFSSRSSSTQPKQTE